MARSLLLSARFPTYPPKLTTSQYTSYDNTTKIFMTQRGDPRARFNVLDGCNPDSAEPQKLLRLRTGDVCVRLASGLRWEFRFSGSGNTKGVYSRGVRAD